MAESSEVRLSRNNIADEAADLLFSLEDGMQLPASLLEIVDSDDGDGKEPDYLTEDGNNLLVTL